jgi:hypothetical protein
MRFNLLIHRKLKWVCLGVAVCLLAGAGPARSQTTKPASEPPAVPSVAEKAKVEQAPETVPEPARPFSLAVSYYLMSDYVFRGVNYSEFAREGREKLNHQLSTSIDVPLGKEGKFGDFGFDTFFEWYSAQKSLNGNGSDFQEVDFGLRYSYDVSAIKTKVTVGWTVFNYPHIVSPRHDRSNEWWFRFDHNDAWMWRWTGYKGEEGILNPSFFMAQDMGYILGQWYEIGLSHPFEVVKNVTWTPKLIFAFDGGYMMPAINGGKGTGEFEYAYTQPGMEIKYDMTELLHLPKWAGSIYISGNLYYNFVSEVERDRANNRPLVKDLLFGGMSVGWNW